MKLREYKQPIFPCKFWVVLTEDLQDIKSKFYAGRHKEEILDNWFEFSEIITFLGQGKSNKKYGVIVATEDVKYLTVKNMAHEAVHVVGYLLEHIGEDEPGEEIRAYLTGWVVECLIDFKNKL